MVQAVERGALFFLDKVQASLALAKCFSEGALRHLPLGISQLGVKKLEQHLGIVLFERRHRGVTITPAGRHFLDEVRRGVGHVPVLALIAHSPGRLNLGCRRLAPLSAEPSAGQRPKHPRESEPDPCDDLNDEIEEKSYLVRDLRIMPRLRRPMFKDDASGILQDKSSADMEHVQRSIGPSGKFFREITSQDRIAKHCSCADGGHSGPQDV
jgi:hypothetical protein